MTAKNQRIPNFTSLEKEILMEIILSKYVDILEDKKTNRATIEKKQEVWNQIEADFNNKAPIVAYRKQDQLKRLYENKKKELRKKMATYKNQLYKTGGGPPPEEPKLDSVEEILIKIINEKSVSGYSAAFDCDASEDEPLAKIPRKDNEKTDYSVYLEPTDHIQEYEFDPQEFGTYVLNNVSDTPDVLVKPLGKPTERCPPSGLERPINDKLKVQPSGSKIIAQPFREISPCTDAGSSSTKTIGLSAVSSIKNKTPSIITPSKTPSSDRRRPMGGVRTLTSSDVSEKYNLLLDKRLVLVKKQIEHNVEVKDFNQEEQNYKIKILKQQEENLNLEKEEKILKIELLKAELKYKKSMFSSNI